MKKILSILVIGITVLYLLSFLPTNSAVNNDVLENGDNYAISVPAKPPTPPKK
jgi:hypothetical protein